ncbi:MAG: hypothetical protein M3237_11310 [Actinomycetota bacterium]|nr:hypothetical protein [Actinomycetota bacterium]
MGDDRYRIVVRAPFESVAAALSSISAIELLRRTDSHVLFTVSSTAVAVARPTDDERVAEVVVLDRTGGMIASNFAEQLRGQLDFEVEQAVQGVGDTRTGGATGLIGERLA